MKPTATSAAGTKPVRLLDLGCVPYQRSQAVYHAVAEAMTEGDPDTVVLVSPDRPYFCVGFHQDARLVLDLDFCAANGLPVLRRRVGGGTTYLDSRQLFYQVILHHERAPQTVDALYAHCLRPPLETLLALGLDADLRGINELTVRGRRIAGTGAARLEEANVVVGNFLFDFDYDTMARAWRGPSRTFLHLASEGLGEHVTTLRREMAVPPSLETVKEMLVAQFVRVWGRPLVPGALTAHEEARVAEAERELVAPEWVYEIEGGITSRGGLKIAGGVFVHHASSSARVGDIEIELEVVARVRHGVLESLALEPLSGCNGPAWEALARMLEGSPLRAQALQHRSELIRRSGIFPAGIDLSPLLSWLVTLSGGY